MEQMELPPGFRFHPTDEELITHYLSKKVLDGNFKAVAIGEVDLNKCEPWDLPWRTKMGEEWYFFCVRDRKYPTGLRTNRATESGYWKATGKDKEIYRGKSLVGMKKTLVFYRGRAPKGEKTDWVMHEYRLEGKANYSVCDLPKNTRNEWVICRVFNKSSAGGKKGCLIAKGGLLQQVRMEVESSSSASYGSSDELDNEGKGNSSLLPPLMDVNIIEEKINRASEPTAAAAHVTCFSNAVLENQKGNVEEEEEKKYSTNPNLSLVPDYYFNKTATATSTSTTSGPFAASDVSPSSIFISKVNMNMSATPSNPLGLNMHHHHQQQQQQQHYITNPSGSLMQLLLQSNVYGVVMDQQKNGSKATDKEMLSNISQETGLTTDMNPEIEISSVNNNDDNVPNANNEVPSTSAALPLHLDDCLWGY